jgi:ferrous iron transport protein A
MSSVLLSQLPSGESGRIQKIQADSALRDRLAALGFRNGARVGVLYSALMGDPRTYMICGSQISLRKAEADLILVDH